MGNIGSTSINGGRRRHGSHGSHPPPAPPQPEISGNHYVYAAARPYPTQYPNPNLPQPQYYPYPGYHRPPPPTMPVPLPVPYDHHHSNWEQYTFGPMMRQPAPFVEHQNAVTIRNEVNLKKETLRLEPDEENPGKFLVTFTFDATTAGSITVIFFAKEGNECNLAPMKVNYLTPATMHFEQGLGQKFRQPSGTGIDFSMFEESELLKEGGEVDIYPLAVKAEASPVNHSSEGNPVTGATNSQITLAVFEKEKGEYQLKVVKQILWVHGTSYELQEIYGIGNSVDGDGDCDVDANDPGKECVICLSELRDTTVLPCRHMCMCSGCAKVLRFQTNRCPICRQLVKGLLEIKVNNGTDE
ncbi:hypothetical protein SLE2022_077370 [Rubroshorea leprosula]